MVHVLRAAHERNLLRGLSVNQYFCRNQTAINLYHARIREPNRTAVRWMWDALCLIKKIILNSKRSSANSFLQKKRARISQWQNGFQWERPFEACRSCE